MQDACGHERMRVNATENYHSGMSDESAEIFDDLYLGLRAGGALRKQRRGEALTTVGTFGLGFTLGGLVFGRWRKPA